MIPKAPQLKRLLLLLLALFSSVLVVVSLFLVFQPSEAADLRPDDVVLPNEQTTPAPDNFELADPYVCIIPTDGIFLPCHANLMADEIPVERSATLLVESAACIDGMAAGFPCDQVDLLSQLTLENFDGMRASDMWGWTDPSNGNEIVILAFRDRTAFIDVSNPFNPQIIGTLYNPFGSQASAWRDVKTYNNTAYIVGDIAKDFGMQIFDLTRLRGLSGNVPLAADNVYQGISSTHNIVINEETGLAALVGISSGVERCSGGMHLLDLSVNRLDPTFAGCITEDGYVHDAQCVIYHGVDVDYVGREICFNFNEDTITIVDVTDRANPVQISRTGYPQSAYTHQGWLTADHEILLADDEGDEGKYGVNTTTHIWDLTSLAEPKLLDAYAAETKAIDHNQYIHLGYSFQANYRAGMRILDTAEVYDGRLNEIAYFDIFPTDDDAKFNAAWSTYPYFESGVIAISGVEQGLFLVQPTGLEFYRASVSAPKFVTVTSGSVVDYEVDLHTLGMTDSYTLTLLNSSDLSWSVSTTQPAVFTGSPTQTERIPISVGVPLTDGGQTEVSLIIKSQQRPGYVVTTTTQFNIVEGELFDVVQADSSETLPTVKGNQIEVPILIKNRSGLPEQFSIEASGDLWAVEPSVAQTPLVGGDESYELVLQIEAGSGVQTSYMLTVTPQSNPAGMQTLASSIELETGASLTQTFSLLQPLVTTQYLLRVKNTGDLPDQFVINIEEGAWLAEATITQTAVISQGAEATFSVLVTVGSGSESLSKVEVVSLRSNSVVAAIDLSTRIYQIKLPLIARSNSVR